MIRKMPPTISANELLIFTEPRIKMPNINVFGDVSPEPMVPMEW
jgi:hypothetical protein